MGCFLFWKEMPLCVLHFPGHWKMQLCKCNSTRYVPKASSYTTKSMSAWRMDSFYSKTCISWFQSASGHSHLLWENLDWPAADRETKQQAVLTLVLCAIRTICKYDVVVQHSKRSTTESMNSCLEVPDLTSPSQCVSLNELMCNVWYLSWRQEVAYEIHHERKQGKVSCSPDALKPPRSIMSPLT